MDIIVTDVPAKARYEAHVTGTAAFGIAEYRRGPHHVAFTHTEVPPELEGHGLAAALARTALDAARRDGLRVLPYCPYFAAFIRRHREYAELVVPEMQSLVDPGTDDRGAATRGAP